MDYTLTLFDGTTNAVVGLISGSLVPFQSVRFLDVFAAAGTPPGDRVNIRAGFTVTTADVAPALVGFCTVQENNTFGADFRIAKSRDAYGNREKRLVCYGSDCVTVNPVNPTQIPDATTKNIHAMFVEQPDYVQCQLLSPHPEDLQIRIRGPGDVFSSPVWPSTPPFSSGGAGLTSFYIFTGYRSAVQFGVATRWFIDVGFNTTSGVAADLPVPYGITCISGNGVSVPYFTTSAALDF